ncbi:hypothetical protein VNI00_006000 [Paramarasmius palmivorus]|uniref:Cation efflux protein transmembrane domain-containing protein n=1 Tax=Paramarasmius palmivorus TaxID=297713 RepID=A0AAW0DCX5_9AGAR
MAGFFPATLYEMHTRQTLCNGDAPGGRVDWLVLARSASSALVDLAGHNSQGHDVGFLSFPFIEELAIDPNNQTAIQVINTFAQDLAARFNPKVGATLSWDPKDDPTQFRVIIDNMMNLEVLFASEELTGNKTLREIAIKHADTTMKNHIRAVDASTWHVVEYNAETGDVVSKYTAQGYSADSTWSRGQAWAMYGFTNMYKRTRKPEYLETARRLATYFISNLPDDGVVPWDFNAPTQDPKVPGGVRPADSSAATIVANGLLLLSTLDDTNGEKWTESAIKILDNITKLAWNELWDSLLSNGTVSRRRNNYLTGIVYEMETLHRRKSSHGDDETENVIPRTRVHSTPVQPPSAGPFRTAFPSSQTLQVNGHARDHSRTRSISTPFSPTLPSPLSGTFPASTSAPEPLNTEQKSRRHGRMHSRNLSIFFPRPGSLPQSTIAEDGSQELEIHNDEESVMPAANSMPNRTRHTSTHGNGPTTPLGAGFTFGARPPGSAPVPPPMSAGGSGSRSRRGHHHKHSLSHNFFSFLEPGSTQPQAQTPESELHTLPTPNPVSPWNPISPFPTTPHTPHPPHHHVEERHKEDERKEEQEQDAPGSQAFALVQFVLGASLWVSGQQNGSLAATGLGYWVVYDAFGVSVEHVLPGYLSRQEQVSPRKRYYGNARIETVLQFSQSVYLMFAAVYICKETVEHVLLSAGPASGEHEGHHHHHADVLGIEFPIILIMLSGITMAVSAVMYGTHRKVAELTRLRIPQLSAQSDLWSNPYITAPLGFAVCLILIATLAPATHHISIDLLLASITTIITFKLAYRASVVLGTVLLQTSPPRGSGNGKMETVLRVMREIERDSRVLHLPAPHIWVLTPGEKGKVVVTMEVHVSKDMPDDEVVKVVRWVRDKVGWAVGSGKGGDGGGQVTVGVVRG